MKLFLGPGKGIPITNKQERIITRKEVSLFISSPLEKFLNVQQGPKLFA
jgi:hypothetical protein